MKFKLFRSSVGLNNYLNLLGQVFLTLLCFAAATPASDLTNFENLIVLNRLPCPIYHNIMYIGKIYLFTISCLSSPKLKLVKIVDFFQKTKAQYLFLMKPLNKMSIPGIEK